MNYHDSSKKPSKKQINFQVSGEEYDILQGIAEAFYKAGAIDKPTIPKLILWNTRKIVSEIMTKRKEQLKAEFDRQQAELKRVDLMKQYPGIYGENKVTR